MFSFILDRTEMKL